MQLCHHTNLLWTWKNDLTCDNERLSPDLLMFANKDANRLKKRRVLLSISHREETWLKNDSNKSWSLSAESILVDIQESWSWLDCQHLTSRFASRCLFILKKFSLYLNLCLTYSKQQRHPIFSDWVLLCCCLWRSLSCIFTSMMPEVHKSGILRDKNPCSHVLTGD